MEQDQTNNEIVFEEDSHTYTRNNQNYTSVTTILAKYGISPAYSNIPASVLANAATRGTAVHAALEQYVLTKVNNGLFTEVDNFERYITQHNIDLNLATPEKLIYDDTYLVAGTLDICYTDENGIFTIADHKTTSTLHFDSVTWQLNLYNFILCKGDITQYYTTNLKVFHYTKNGMFEVRECPSIDYDIVKALLVANLNNDPVFNVPQLGLQPLPNTKVLVLENLVEHLADLDKEKKRTEDQIKKFKDEVYSNFVKNKQVSWKFTGANSMINAVMVKGKSISTLDKAALDLYLKSQGKSLDDFTLKSVGKEYVAFKLGTKNSNSLNNNITEEDL